MKFRGGCGEARRMRNGLLGGGRERNIWRESNEYIQSRVRSE